MKSKYSVKCVKNINISLSVVIIIVTGRGNWAGGIYRIHGNSIQPFYKSKTILKLKNY